MALSDHKFLYALHTVPGIGAQKLRALLCHFSSAQAAWTASKRDLMSAGIGESLCSTLAEAREKYDTDAAWQKLVDEDIFLITEDDTSYPPSLADMPGSPYVLYCRGSAQVLCEPSVAIVGSRKFSPYGKQAATRLACDIASQGVHIVSGLALGIDGIAHRGALQSTSTGTTIAVLGGGVDDASIAPQTHIGLAKEIVKSGGALVSVYPPGTKPSKGTFPARNAVMASLSRATIVIEAAQGSGTLITAGLTLSYGRTLFAVPGSIFAKESVGTNTLIAQNSAQIVRNAHDVLTTLGLTNESATQKKNHTPADPQEKLIYEILEEHADGTTIDKIIRVTTLEGAVVTQKLVMMEIDGIVHHLGGGIYALR